jgi:hypothetical protein
MEHTLIGREAIGVLLLWSAPRPTIVDTETEANQPQKEIHIHETQSDITRAKSEFKQTEHGALWASVTQSLEDKW